MTSSNNALGEHLLCTHCDEPVAVPLYTPEDREKNHAFCCDGCLTVYNIINAKGLNEYYSIKENSKIFKRRSPVEFKNEKFTYIDKYNFLEEYSITLESGNRVMDFYLEGIHCVACLWLIEKMPEFVPGVIHSRLNMSKSLVTITIKRDFSFAEVARELNNLGYRPHPLKIGQTVELLKRQEERSLLIKMGVAGACAGNIMIYAFSIYGGAEGEVAHTFGWLTVLLALPAMTYSASPLYASAWNALKNKKMSVDIPIVLSLFMGTVMGIWNMLHGNHENFFDSLTALIFLLLLSRFFLRKLQMDGMNASDMYLFYEAETVERQNKATGEFEEMRANELALNDVIRINPGHVLPIDGEIKQGRSHFNLSLLTGESVPVLKNVGDEVYSGTTNLDHEILVEVKKVGKETRLGKILSQVERGWQNKAKINLLIDIVAEYFTVAVILLASILFYWIGIHQGQISVGLTRALTLLIVTCPCALALATPLTFSRTLSRASRLGMILKNDEVIEKMAKIKSVVFDKTGTLTFGQFKVVNWIECEKTQDNLASLIWAMEEKSKHPIAQSLKQYVQRNFALESIELENYNEIVGQGIEATWNNKHYQVKGLPETTNHNKWIGLYQEQHLLIKIELSDTLRPDSKKAIELLHKMQIECVLASGDHSLIVHQIANDLKLPAASIYAEVSPEEKLKLIEKQENRMMVGDGANDAMALGHAFVGVAVQGSMDVALRASDAYLTTPGIGHVAEMIVMAKETMNVIHRNFIISIAYNCLSVWATFTGHISPLVAAIVMPISSLSVLLSTHWGTEKLNKILKGESIWK